MTNVGQSLQALTASRHLRHPNGFRVIQMLRPEDSLAIVIDADPSIISAIQQTLEARGLNVSAFSSTDEFLAFDRPDKPQCILIDNDLLGASDVALPEPLNPGARGAPVLRLIDQSDVSTAVRALTRSPMDLVQKPITPEELVFRVQSAIERHHAARESARARADWNRRQATLSLRERDVLEQMAQGHPNKIIAVNLHISIKTVEIHRSRVMQKMEADSLAALMRQYFAVRSDTDRP